MATVPPGRARAFWLAREQKELQGQEQQGMVNGFSGTVHAARGRIDGSLNGSANGSASPQGPSRASPRTWGAARESEAWASLYCTLRDKRRARSRTPGVVAGSSGSEGRRGSSESGEIRALAMGRSLTPSSFSSGRTTPSPSPTPSPARRPQYRMASRSVSEEVLNAALDSPDASPAAARAACVPAAPRRFQTMCWLETRPIPIRYISTVYSKMGSTKKHYIEEIHFKTRLVPRRYSESIISATTIASRRFTSVLEIQCLPNATHVIHLDQPPMNGF